MKKTLISGILLGDYRKRGCMQMVGRRKKHIGLKVFLVIIAIIIVAGVVCKEQIKNVIGDKVAEVAVEKLIDEKLNDDSLTYGDVSAKEILDNMDEEDKQTVTDIVKDNMTAENIKTAESYVKSGDTDGLKEYVKETLSEEDKATVTEMYEKYKNTVN